MFQLKAVFLVLLYEYGYGCDFVRNVEIGKEYYIASPDYPANYTPGVQCRWIGNCPVNYTCRLDCSVIDIPQAPSCNLDRLLISKSGDTQLAGAEYYCGRGSLVAVSTGQRISVGLVTTKRTSPPGGRFICQLTAQPVSSTQQKPCSCGYTKRNRIVGGQPTKINEYPSMAALVDEDERKIFCGGTIIDSNYVLTAAHCLANRNINRLAVVVGEYDTSTGTETSAVQGFRILYAQVHPQYNSNTYDYDIAILALDGQISFNDAVGPACLPFKFTGYDFSGQNVTILGWGTQFFGGPDSKVLRSAVVKVISQTSCYMSISTLTSRQLCTYTPGKDSCQNDSGGPLLYTDQLTGLLFNVGIVSFGRFCASNSPSVNTRITTVLDWITDNAPADYCRK